jgi:hypothetical protein
LAQCDGDKPEHDRGKPLVIFVGGSNCRQVKLDRAG